MLNHRYTKKILKMNQEQILGVVRHILTFVGGILIAKGLLAEALTEEIIGGVMTLAGTVWSIFSKKKAA